MAILVNGTLLGFRLRPTLLSKPLLLLASVKHILSEVG